MKIETKEIIKVEKTAMLTITEARLLNIAVEHVLDMLESCGSISHGDIKSYRQNYSPARIDYQELSQEDESSLLESALYFFLRFGSIGMAISELKAAEEEMRTADPDFIPEVYNRKELAKTAEYKKWIKDGCPLVEVKEEDMSEEERKNLKQNTEAQELLNELKENRITDFSVLY